MVGHCVRAPRTHLAHDKSVVCAVYYRQMQKLSVSAQTIGRAWSLDFCTVVLDFCTEGILQEPSLGCHMTRQRRDHDPPWVNAPQTLIIIRRCES